MAYLVLAEAVGISEETKMVEAIFKEGKRVGQEFGENWESSA